MIVVGLIQPCPLVGTVFDRLNTTMRGRWVLACKSLIIIHQALFCVIWPGKCILGQAAFLPFGCPVRGGCCEQGSGFVCTGGVIDGLLRGHAWFLRGQLWPSLSWQLWFSIALFWRCEPLCGIWILEWAGLCATIHLSASCLPPLSTPPPSPWPPCGRLTCRSGEPSATPNVHAME